MDAKHSFVINRCALLGDDEHRAEEPRRLSTSEHRGLLGAAVGPNRIAQILKPEYDQYLLTNLVEHNSLDPNPAQKGFVAPPYMAHGASECTYMHKTSIPRRATLP